MDLAIEFDSKPCLITVKIGNESGDHLLTPKSASVEFASPQTLPKRPFGGRRAAAHCTWRLEFREADSLPSN
jgi:hypothetical protein